MTRRAYLYFVMTFILGILVGGAGVLFYGWHFGRWHRGYDKDRIVRHMTRELRLSEPQAQQISRIMEESGKRFEELRRQHRPQFDALRKESRDRIRQVLTPEQAAKFDEMVRRLDERRKRAGPSSR